MLLLLYNIFEKASIMIYNVFGDLMFTIKNSAESMFIVKNSKFISKIYNVDKVGNVKKIINDLQEEYKDATHICYAYIINDEKKAFDDNEPSKTAGMPILNVLEKNDLNFVLLVVIRYFGGIKLGASNLIRAYLKASKDVLDKVDIISYVKTYSIRITFSYENLKDVNYILKDNNITSKEYNQSVIYEFTYEDGKYPKKLDQYIIEKKEL